MIQKRKHTAMAFIHERERERERESVPACVCVCVCVRSCVRVRFIMLCMNKPVYECTIFTPLILCEYLYISCLLKSRFMYFMCIKK